MDKSIVLYFSRPGQNYRDGEIVDLDVGNTEVVAKNLADITGSKLYEIETVEEYPNDYRECVEIAKEELKTQALPELKEPLESIEDYDSVYVCGPIWCGHYPQAVISQLEKLDLSGVDVYPITTHEGSGFGLVLEDLKNACPGAAIKDGLAVHGGQVGESSELINEWLERM